MHSDNAVLLQRSFSPNIDSSEQHRLRSPQRGQHYFWKPFALSIEISYGKGYLPWDRAALAVDTERFCREVLHPGCGRNAAQVGGDRQLLPSAGRSHSAAKQRQRGCSGPAATATEPLGLAAHRRGSSAVTSPSGRSFARVWFYVWVSRYVRQCSLFASDGNKAALRCVPADCCWAAIWHKAVLACLGF